MRKPIASIRNGLLLLACIVVFILVAAFFSNQIA